MSPTAKVERLQNLISELYLHIKNKTRQSVPKVQIQSPNSKIEADFQNIKKIDTLLTIEYIKSAVDIIMNIKMEDILKAESLNENPLDTQDVKKALFEK